MQISLDRKRLSVLFAWSLLMTLAMPVLWPSLNLLFFSPFLVIACYQRSLSFCLWLAFLCGIILDLLSPYAHFGLHAFDFCLTTACIYTQRKNFFADSLTTLPLMTFFFSVFSTFLMSLLLQSIESQKVISLKWYLTDLFLMPLFDALYAFSCFTLPALIFGKRRRRGKEYFLSH